jgi:hypothetical protein
MAPSVTEPGCVVRVSGRHDSEIMPSAADRMAGHPEQRQDGADHHDDNADRPDDGNLRNEPDNEQDNTEDDQVRLLAVVSKSFAPRRLVSTGPYS